MSLRRLRSRLHTTFSLFTDFNHLLNSELHLIVTKMLYTLTVELGNACKAIQWQYDDKTKRFSGSWHRRRSHKFSRASLCRPPMTICGQNVDTCKPASDQVEIFPAFYRKYLYSLLSSLSLYYAGSPKVPPRVFGQKNPAGAIIQGMIGEAKKQRLRESEGTLSYRCLYLCLLQCGLVNLHFRDFPFEMTLISSLVVNPHSNCVGEHNPLTEKMVAKETRGSQMSVDI